jgi:hypothetical protein
MKNTPNIMPSEGDYAIIMVKNGILEIYTGNNINKVHDDLHIIEEFFISDNTVHIKAKKIKELIVDMKVTEHEGYQIFGSRELYYEDIIEMVKNPDFAIHTFHRKRTWLMKLLGKPEIKYNYITLEDANCWGENKRHLILKPEYWTPKEYQSNTYTISKV